MKTRVAAQRDGHSESARPVLVVTPMGAGREDLFQELQSRADFRILFAANVPDAEIALRGQPVSLLIASPEISTHGVNQLVTSLERIRPGIPLLVIRERQAEEAATWSKRGVGILRCPLLPQALGRSVEVVLGLRNT